MKTPTEQQLDAIEQKIETIKQEEVARSFITDSVHKTSSLMFEENADLAKMFIKLYGSARNVNSKRKDLNHKLESCARDWEMGANVFYATTITSDSAEYERAFAAHKIYEQMFCDMWLDLYPAIEDYDILATIVLLARIAK